MYTHIYTCIYIYIYTHIVDAIQLLMQKFRCGESIFYSSCLCAASGCRPEILQQGLGTLRCCKKRKDSNSTIVVVIAAIIVIQQVVVIVGTVVMIVIVFSGQDCGGTQGPHSKDYNFT